MFGFFRRRKQQAEVRDEAESGPETTAPGTEIRYHENLVPELLEDHQTLLALFEKVSQAQEAGEFQQLPSMLEEFGSLLRGHLLKENVRLYIYLQHALANDPDNSALMQGFRTEMHGISKVVNRFLRHYGQTEWDQQRREDFASELKAIGEVLVKRIETEEKVLYPLYMPPGSYS